MQQEIVFNYSFNYGCMRWFKVNPMSSSAMSYPLLTVLSTVSNVRAVCEMIQIVMQMNSSAVTYPLYALWSAVSNVGCVCVELFNSNCKPNEFTGNDIPSVNFVVSCKHRSFCVWDDSHCISSEFISNDMPTVNFVVSSNQRLFCDILWLFAPLLEALWHISCSYEEKKWALINFVR